MPRCRATRTSAHCLWLNVKLPLVAQLCSRQPPNRFCVDIFPAITATSQPEDVSIGILEALGYSLLTVLFTQRIVSFCSMWIAFRNFTLLSPVMLLVFCWLWFPLAVGLAVFLAVLFELLTDSETMYASRETVSFIRSLQKSPPVLDSSLQAAQPHRVQQTCAVGRRDYRPSRWQIMSITGCRFVDSSSPPVPMPLCRSTQPSAHHQRIRLISLALLVRVVVDEVCLVPLVQPQGGSAGCRDGNKLCCRFLSSSAATNARASCASVALPQSSALCELRMTATLCRSARYSIAAIK